MSAMPPWEGKGLIPLAARQRAAERQRLAARAARLHALLEMVRGK
jgi:hypothetical protein